MINHHRDDVHFRGNAALPLNAGALHSLFLPRFRHIDVASLIPLITSRFGSGSYSKVVTTLVNVCSPFSGFSHGYNPAPPESVQPLGCHILFTFGFRYRLDYDDDSLEVHNTSIRSTIWGSGKDSRRFLTIGITSVEAAQMGLIHVQSNEILYLYRMVGMIFRSIFMHCTPGEIDDLKRGQVTPLFDDDPSKVFVYKDRFLTIPLSGIVRHPYSMWRFNREIWRLAPNCIPYSTVEPELALYYFMFISKDLQTIVPPYDGLRKILGTTAGTSQGISKILVQSLMSFSQYLRSSSDFQFELVDLIAANVLVALLYTSSNKIVVNRATCMKDLEENTVALATQLRSMSTIDLAQAFAPYDDTAQALIDGDTRPVNALFSSISYSNIQNTVNL